MILNVSGRTDVVAFYEKWFEKRYREGFVDVRNPFNTKLVSRIYFDDVDLILFCTKNPLPIIDFLPSIDKPIIFHVTLTPYQKDLEPYVIDKRKIIEGIKKISEIIGIDNVYVRYDPILLNDKYDIAYHKKMFERMCISLNGYVKNIIVSFVDEYKNVRKNREVLKYRPFSESDYKEIGTFFATVASQNKMTVQTCFEERNLVEYGFKKGECISRELAYKMTGKTYKKWKARNCSCAEMVDIGVYNSCRHFCKYCYANYDEVQVERNSVRHDVNSSLLVGNLAIDDVIKVRRK